MAVTTCLTGGFGNQLFQYAMGYAVSKDSNDTLFIDVSHFKYDKRSCQINKLNISAKKLDVKPAKKNTTIYRLLARLRRLSKTGLFTTTFFQEDSSKIWQYAYPNIKYNKSIYLNGYWQNYRYFDEYRDELLNEFKPKKGSLGENALCLIKNIKKENSVALHIRRGDYVECDNWLIDDSYYNLAIEKMNLQLNDNKVVYYVFCEDEDYAKELLVGKDYILVTGNYDLNDFEEFFVMSACNNHIICNSTFSWWAAYLHNDENEKNHFVVAPTYKQWTKDFYLPQWLTIDMNNN